MTYKAVRSVSLSVDLIRRIEDLMFLVRDDRSLAVRFGIVDTDLFQVDEVGFAPSDYPPLQELVHSKLTGRALFDHALLNYGTRDAAMSIIRKAIAKNNQILRRQIEPGRGVNFSTVLEVVLTRGLPSIDAGLEESRAAAQKPAVPGGKPFGYVATIRALKASEKKRK